MHVDMSALQALTTEKEMSLNALIISIEGAVLTAYNHTDHALEHARCHLERETGEIQIFVPVFSETGDRIGEVQDRNEEFTRVATSTARQAIKQYMRQTKDAGIVGELSMSVGDVISGMVEQGRDGKMIYVNLGKTEGKVPPQEQVPGEHFEHGDRIKCFVVDVKQGTRGPEITLSRSHPALVKQLFALEVPEIKDRVVEIMGIAREAGHRTKISVRAHRSGVSAKGALIGPMGARARAVMDELHGEKIDIVDYSDDPAVYVANALAPAKVASCEVVDEATRSAKVIVPDYQLSLAIGKDGQNARLAARLTGWRIDIHSDSPTA